MANERYTTAPVSPPTGSEQVVDEFLLMMIINSGLMDWIDIGTFAGTVETFYNTEDTHFITHEMTKTMEYLVTNGYARVGFYDENGMFFADSNPLFYNVHILTNIVLYDPSVEFDWMLLLDITEKAEREYEEYCKTHDYKKRSNQLYAAFDARREKEKQAMNP